jgi:hypothetical protein
MLMLVLYCTRGVADTVVSVLACVEACVGVNLCEYCVYRNTLQMLARMCTDVYFGMHPILLVLLAAVLQARAVPTQSSTLVTSLVLANTSSYFSHADVMPILDARSRVDEVEYIMWAMPFAMAVAVSYLCVCRAFACQELADANEWNDDVLEGGVFMYEVAYHFELFFLNVSLVGPSCSGQSLGLVVYASATITLLQAYFVAGSRSTMECHAHAVLSMMLAAVFVLALVSVLAFVHVCVLSRLLGVLLAMTSCAVVLGHHSAFGKASVCHVIILRLCPVAAVSMTHIVVMCVGRTAICDMHDA